MNHFAARHSSICMIPDHLLIDKIEMLWADEERPVFVYSDSWTESYHRSIEKQLEAIRPENSSLFTDSFLVPTGGTSGQLKIAILSKKALQASVAAMQKHFELATIDSICLLPLYHVGGLLQVIRSYLTNGKFYHEDYQSFKKNCFPKISGACLSLVPTQWNFLRQSQEALQFLSRQEIVFLGGAPSTADDLRPAIENKINLRPVYGMTETCAMIAGADLQKIKDKKIVYDPFAGVTLRASKESTLEIMGDQLFSGYLPDPPSEVKSHQTEDLVAFSGQSFSILGRNDQVIISGGKKVIPLDVSTALQKAFLFEDLFVTGEPDPYWGEKVVCYYQSSKNYRDEELKSGSSSILANYQIPKAWCKVEKIPRNDAGKIQQTELPPI